MHSASTGEEGLVVLRDSPLPDAPSVRMDPKADALGRDTGRADGPKTPRFPCISLCPGTESNCLHTDFQSVALPVELPGRMLSAVGTYAISGCAVNMLCAVGRCVPNRSPFPLGERRGRCSALSLHRAKICGASGGWGGYAVHQFQFPLHRGEDLRSFNTDKGRYRANPHCSSRARRDWEGTKPKEPSDGGEIVPAEARSPTRRDRVQE